MDKINVGLYGGANPFRKGRETPLRAEEVYCDKYNECSLYNSGCCLNVQSKCKYGEVKILMGYTSRSTRYSKFKNKFLKDEKYRKLISCSNTLIGLVGEYVYLDVDYCKVVLNEDDTYIVEESFLADGSSWIENSKFTKDLLYKVCSYVPYGCSKDKYKGIISDMLGQLKKLDINFYEDFIKTYPEFESTPNYIGKYAYISTLKVGSELVCNGGRFIFDGEYLICKNWNSSFIPFGASESYMKIKVTKDMEYKIDDNSLVDENTVFVP